jgi:zinc protease
MGDVARRGRRHRAAPDREPAADGPVPPLPAVVKLPARDTELNIEHPASQSHILMGQPGMRRGDPDYFPLQVGNYILGGGGFASRLSKEVREKRGSPTALQLFLAAAEAGPFQIGLQTKRTGGRRAQGGARDGAGAS